MDIDYQWRGEFENVEINALHAEGFGHRLLNDDWQGQLDRHSLGWVCARSGKKLVGVAEHARRQGIGAKMISIAISEARAAGCEWLHVDFDDELRTFYLDACGFTPTAAGVIAL